MSPSLRSRIKTTKYGSLPIVSNVPSMFWTIICELHPYSLVLKRKIIFSYKKLYFKTLLYVMVTCFFVIKNVHKLFAFSIKHDTYIRIIYYGAKFENRQFLFVICQRFLQCRKHKYSTKLHCIP